MFKKDIKYSLRTSYGAYYYETVFDVPIWKVKKQIKKDIKHYGENNILVYKIDW